MKKVLIQYFTLPHYRISLFNKIGKYKNIDLKVIYTPYNNSRINFSGIEYNQDNINNFNEKKIDMKVFHF